MKMTRVERQFNRLDVNASTRRVNPGHVTVTGVQRLYRGAQLRLEPEPEVTINGKYVRRTYVRTSQNSTSTVTLNIESPSMSNCMFVQGFSLTLSLTLSNLVMSDSPAQLSLPAINIALSLVPSGTTGFAASFKGTSEGLVTEKMTEKNSAYVQERPREDPGPRQSSRSCFSVPPDGH